MHIDKVEYDQLIKDRGQCWRERLELRIQLAALKEKLEEAKRERDDLKVLAAQYTQGSNAP